MKKNLEGKYFGQFLVSMPEKMLKNKYMGISLNSMKTVKKNRDTEYKNSVSL